jgi:hypothetical protein
MISSVASDTFGVSSVRIIQHTPAFPKIANSFPAFLLNQLTLVLTSIPFLLYPVLQFYIIVNYTLFN